MIDLLNYLDRERDIVEELIKIDNNIMNVKDSYNNYIDSFRNILETDVNYFDIDSSTIFITEGEVLVTLEILRRLNTDNDVIIYINQGYVGMNKWLINKYYELTGNSNILLDTGNSYNKYIDNGYKVYPLGEDELVSQVLEDFYDKR